MNARRIVPLALIAATAVLPGVAAAAPRPGGIPGNAATIPYFTSTFSYGGQSYGYRMPGTDPQGAPATTKIGVEIVPLQLVFSNGIALSARPKVKAVLASPLFRQARFLSGFTQYGDAMQRAQFWSFVRHKAWHVQLVPTVGPQARISVPSADGWAARSEDGGLAGNLSQNFFESKVVLAIIGQLHLDPHKLSVFLTHHVYTYPASPLGPFYADAGIHGAAATQGLSRIWTWVEASWNDTSNSCCRALNVEPLSQQLMAWLQNPFVGADNVVPPWRTAGTLCTNVLDPDTFFFEHRRFAFNGSDLYDPPFLSWFARQSPSTGIDGRYDYLGRLNFLPAHCRLPGS